MILKFVHVYDCLDHSGNIFLASGSQDAVIRLWKFAITENDSTCKPDQNLKDKLQLETKQFNVIKQDGSICSYIIQLETVISGHDGWIYGVHWKPNCSSGIKNNQL